MGAFTASVRSETIWLIVARILLDSTVLIDALRGRPAAERIREMRRNGDEPWTCAVCVEEIWRGSRPEEESAITSLFNGLRIAHLTAREGRLAGAWRRDHAAEGITLHQADCLVAAAAVGIGARLATGNPKDFPMVDLVVEAWPVGR